MEALEAILTRRSIRCYTTDRVPEQTVTELLTAAMSAPSAGNQQPWQFVVMRDRQLIDQIPAIHPYAQMVREAAVVILVCGDLEKEKHAGYWVQDCSAATQNLLLAAHARALGAVWLGVFPRDDRVASLRELLGLPRHVVPLALISIGRPAETKPRADRYDPERVHYDGW
jgi:nitroreductase